MAIQLGIRMSGKDLVVAAVQPASIAEELGVLVGDKILALLPGEPLTSMADFTDRLEQLDEQSLRGCQVLREGSIWDLVERKTRPAFDDNLVTTLPSLPGYRTIRTLGVVTAIDSNAGWTARTKGRRAFASAAALLLEEAETLGGNAVLGLNASAFAAGGGITNVLGGDAVGVALYGTAAIVEPETTDLNSAKSPA